MPSGKLHLQLEMLVLALLLIAAAVAVAGGWIADGNEWRQPALSFVAAYLFSSLLLSPDMDLARSNPQNRWGILRVLWWPYARLFRHRGWSHNPLLGPLSRVLYLGVIVALLWTGLHYWLSVEMVELGDLVKWWKRQLEEEWLWALIAGLLLPNELHILADRLMKN